MADSTTQPALGAPWYRQFWVWFVIALPLASVVASFATLWIALDAPDPLVREDWYEGGQGINDELAAQREAADRGIAATLSVDDDGSVRVRLTSRDGAMPPELVLDLAHPTQAARDLHLVLAHRGQGLYEGRVAFDEARDHEVAEAAGGYRLRLKPLASDWLLVARVALGRADVHVTAQAPTRAG
jgi:hypothetical protein